MRIQRLCVVSFWVALLLFGNVMAETLFFDDFEGNTEIEWPDVPAIKIEKEPGNPDNTVLVLTQETTKPTPMPSSSKGSRI